MNQRDEAEGRNTERERVIAGMTEAVQDKIVQKRLPDELLRQMKSVADMLRADAGNEATIERLERELRIAELKNRGSLVHNLCPDYRDKQKGKPCLACSIQTLERKLTERDVELAESRKLLTDIRDDVKEAWNYSVLDDARNQTKVDKHFGDRMARIDAAITAAANPVDEGEGQ